MSRFIRPAGAVGERGGRGPSGKVDHEGGSGRLRYGGIGGVGCCYACLLRPFVTLHFISFYSALER